MKIHVYPNDIGTGCTPRRCWPMGLPVAEETKEVRDGLNTDYCTPFVRSDLGAMDWGREHDTLSSHYGERTECDEWVTIYGQYTFSLLIFDI